MNACYGEVEIEWAATKLIKFYTQFYEYDGPYHCVCLHRIMKFNTTNLSKITVTFTLEHNDVTVWYAVQLIVVKL